MLPTLTILAAWLGWGLVLFGAGALVEKLFGTRPRSAPDQAWLGFAALVVLGQGWHLLLPLDGSFALVCGALALAGLCSQGRAALAERLRSLRAAPLAALLLCGLALWLANLATRAPGNPDTGFYFLQTVRWYERYPTVPGLGNLQPHLALNHAYFIYAALVDCWPLWHRGYHVGNGLLFVLALAPMVRGAVRLADFRTPLSLHDFTAAFVLPLLLVEAMRGGNLSSPAADGAVLAFGAALALRLLSSWDEPQAARALLAHFALALLAVTLKQTLAFVALPCLFALALRARPRPSPARLGGAALVALVVLGPWVANGIVQSGFPLFPLPLGRVGVSWALSEQEARSLSRYMFSFARQPRWHVAAEIHGLAWVPEWLAKEWLNDLFLVPVVLAAIASIGAAVQLVRGLRGSWALLAPLAVFLAAIAFWWLTAPAVRFAGPLLFCLAAQLLWCWKALQRPGDEPQWRAVFSLLLVAAVWWLFAAGAPGFSPRATFAEPAPEQSRPYVLPSGDVIRMDQGSCLDLPCASPEAKALRLRVPGDLSKGFLAR